MVLTAMSIALVILYRIQIKVKVFPKNSTAKTIIGDGNLIALKVKKLR